MKKKKGFTLLELIIVLALTLVVISVASTFFISTIKTFKRAEISSNLQLEAEQIEDELVSIGFQSEGIESINNLYLSSTEGKYETVLNDEGKIVANKIKFNLISGYYSLEVEGNKLLAKKYNSTDLEINKEGYPKTITKNLEEISIRPLNYLMNSTGTLKNTKAVQINIKLKDVKGDSEIEVPLSLIIQFKNR